MDRINILMRIMRARNDLCGMKLLLHNKCPIKSKWWLAVESNEKEKPNLKTSEDLEDAIKAACSTAKTKANKISVTKNVGKDDNQQMFKKTSRNVPCKVCGKMFTLSDRLNSHQLKHDTQLPHECEECGQYWNTTHSKLKVCRVEKEAAKCETLARR